MKKLLFITYGIFLLLLLCSCSDDSILAPEDSQSEEISKITTVGSEISDLNFKEFDLVLNYGSYYYCLDRKEYFYCGENEYYTGAIYYPKMVLIDGYLHTTYTYSGICKLKIISKNEIRISHFNSINNTTYCDIIKVLYRNRFGEAHYQGTDGNSLSIVSGKFHENSSSVNHKWEVNPAISDSDLSELRYNDYDLVFKKYRMDYYYLLFKDKMNGDRFNGKMYYLEKETIDGKTQKRYKYTGEVSIILHDKLNFLNVECNSSLDIVEYNSIKEEVSFYLMKLMPFCLNYFGGSEIGPDGYESIIQLNTKK